ncbi:MAG: Na+/H+ antiporter subunit E [Bacteroidales bacterium]|nr:Na+/H+ antiporter subunit E [Bacteroidales bacterium]
MKIKNIFVSFLVIMIGWMLLTWSLDMSSVLLGIGISLALSIVLCNSCTLFNEINLTPKAFAYFFWYIIVFMIELVKANIDVTRRVLSPSMPINPGIVKVETTLKSKMARLILANSITLTPGTFTIEINDDAMYIHWIDVESEDVEGATNAIVRKFEKLLEVMYG